MSYSFHKTLTITSRNGQGTSLGHNDPGAQPTSGQIAPTQGQHDPTLEQHDPSARLYYGRLIPLLTSFE